MSADGVVLGVVGLYGRPDSWNWLLLFHVFAAMVLAGGLLAVVAASVAAARRTAQQDVLLLRRASFLSHVWFVVPGILAVYFLGAVLADKEYPGGDNSPGWLDAAWELTHLAGLLSLLVGTPFQWWALRRARRGELRGWQAQVATWVPAVVLALLVVIIFLMTAKPD